MMPYLNPGQIVIGYGWYRRLRPRDVVIIDHDGMEKIKRIVSIHEETVIVAGDNQTESTDSRHFGPVPIVSVRAKVIS